MYKFKSFFAILLTIILAALLIGCQASGENGEPVPDQEEENRAAVDLASKEDQDKPDQKDSGSRDGNNEEVDTDTENDYDEVDEMWLNEAESDDDDEVDEMWKNRPDPEENDEYDQWWEERMNNPPAGDSELDQYWEEKRNYSPEDKNWD